MTKLLRKGYKNPNYSFIRIKTSMVFFICALLAGAFNLAIVMEGFGVLQLLLFRFTAGFFLAGIYPVGMKIASDYYQKGLGRSLGFLVGACIGVGHCLPSPDQKFHHQPPLEICGIFHLHIGCSRWIFDDHFRSKRTL